jgi:hypothetical protein
LTVTPKADGPVRSSVLAMQDAEQSESLSNSKKKF